MVQIQKITTCAFIYNSQNKVLIAKRAKTKRFLPNKWELPGGHTEFGETLQESLIRELKEELQIDVVVYNSFDAFTYVTKLTHTVEVDFLATMKDENQQILINPKDHSMFQWISKDEVSQFFEPDGNEKKVIIRGFEVIESI